MFNNLNDINKAIMDFRLHNGRYPNVIFISKENKASFFKIIDNHYYYSNPSQGFNEMELLGLKVKFTQSLDGLDYVAEFDKSSSLENFNSEYLNYPSLPEYMKKIFVERPYNGEKTKIPEKPKQKKKRRIIL